MKTSSIQIRIYRDVEDLEPLLPAWEDLVAHYPQASSFSTWRWLVSWWRAFGEDRELLVLAFHDETSRLIALAPLSIRNERVLPVVKLRVLRLLGDGSGDSDNLDFPVRVGCEDVFAATFLNYLKSRAKDWDLCEMNTLPSHSPAGKALAKHLKEGRWVSYVHPRAWSVVDLPDTWEEYLKKLSAKERGKVGYYSRRLEKKYRVRFYKCTEEACLPQCLDILFKLHHERWRQAGEAGSFSSAARRQFYLEMGREFLRRGWLEFFLLDINGTPVAAQFGFRYDTTVFALQEGRDPAYSLDAVGYVLRARALKEFIADGLRRYDFLAGDDEYKARWGTCVGKYLDIHFARPLTRGSVYLRSVHRRTAGKEWLRAKLPQTVWSVLHQINTRVRLNRAPGKLLRQRSKIVATSEGLPRPLRGQPLLRRMRVDRGVRRGEASLASKK
ncbi:MAG TPA: GNAT family N-acetyltransferase [Terriglobia bacterium]|nr:GNAT family N-acetyltransferase [Terriglobia bacterium]